MASYSKTAKGWRAQISIKGVRDSGTFSTKAQATAWVAERETEIRNQRTTGVVPGKTFADACRRYEIEVSRSKKGSRWEAFRLHAMINVGLPHKKIHATKMGDILLAEMTSDLIGKWRDLRLTSVSGATVNRELNLLSHVLSTARKEWGWMSESPTTDVRRPKDSPPRDRRVTQGEIEQLCMVLGFGLFRRICGQISG